MSRQPQYGPEYDRERESTVILEDLRGQFKTFGEGLEDVRKRVERIEEKVDRLEVKVDRLEVRVNRLEVKVDRLEVEVGGIRSFLEPFVATVSNHEKRLTAIEKAR